MNLYTELNEGMKPVAPSVNTVVSMGTCGASFITTVQLGSRQMLNNYMLDRESTERRVVQNLAEANIITEYEQQAMFEHLSTLDEKDLIAMLLESHNLRELTVMPSKVYPVDIRYIGRN